MSAPGDREGGISRQLSVNRDAMLQKKSRKDLKSRDPSMVAANLAPRPPSLTAGPIHPGDGQAREPRAPRPLPCPARRIRDEVCRPGERRVRAHQVSASL